MWWLGDLDTTDPPYALVSILKQFGADNAGPMGLLESINGPLQDLWLTSSCLYTALQNTLYECSLQCLSQAPRHHLDPGQQQGKGYIKSPSSIPGSTLQGFKICKKSTRSYSCLGLPPKSLATQDWPSHLPIDPCRNPRCAARASGVERRTSRARFPKVVPTPKCSQDDQYPPIMLAKSNGPTG